ncbi:DUF742 domain-containing protein [Dactylosporangium sp. NPDC051485]|uniref:DUF742 domain-containing protein n=1 Tax=Dactylosporangium sp. NPDC051485 TaxID=3154846 RepID=UPI003413B4A9
MEPNHSDEPDEVWVDADAGPVVRPYAMTRGRTQPTSGNFDLITIVMTVRAMSPVDVGLGPEHEAIVQLCQQPTSVAELSANLNLPVGTVRVLLGDLLSRVLIVASNPDPVTNPPGDDLFEAVINGIRRL